VGKRKCALVGLRGYGFGALRHFQQYFSYIVAVSFIGGGNLSTWRKLSVLHNCNTHFLSYCCLLILSYSAGGRRGHDHTVVFLLHVQLGPISTKIVSLNPSNGEAYSI
jgi:hypothetical protein